MRKFSIPVLLLVSATVATIGLSRLRAGDETTPTKEKRLETVVHVNFADADRQGKGLKNIENIWKAVDGNATIEVVCHGSGINLAVKDQSKHADRIQALQKRGVRFVACRNTLREKKIPKESLLPGFEIVPSGAVEVIRKQQDGFGYFRP